MKNNLFLYGILLLICGCTEPAAKTQKNTLSYFDIKSYFDKEALRLTASNPLINKTVVINNAAENKSLKISDWKKELFVFSDANINRAAWKGLFVVNKSTDKDVYTSDNDKVPVKEVQIIKKHDKVAGIRLLIKNTNSLYTSTDTLSYFPDSLYEIRKTQRIKLLSEKNYRITGKFK